METWGQGLWGRETHNSKAMPRATPLGPQSQSLAQRNLPPGPPRAGNPRESFGPISRLGCLGGGAGTQDGVVTSGSVKSWQGRGEGGDLTAALSFFQCNRSLA